MPKEKHRMTHTKIYSVWSSMKQRCYNKNQRNYKYYGGRGITIQSEFYKSFISFYSYVSSLPSYDEFQLNNSLISLDRIDVNGNYQEGNLRWVDFSTQQKNKRLRKDSKSGFTGVYLDKRRGKWKAYVTENGKEKYIGYNFTTKIDAHKARIKYLSHKK